MNEPISPPRNEKINTHEFCLHLWRPQQLEIPLPHRIMV